MADTFTVTWMNRLDQFGSSSLTLLVVHDQGVIPDYRVEKSYQAEDPADIDSAFLEARAQEEILIIVDSWNQVEEQ